SRKRSVAESERAVFMAADCTASKILTRAEWKLLGPRFTGLDAAPPEALTGAAAEPRITELHRITFHSESQNLTTEGGEIWDATGPRQRRRDFRKCTAPLQAQVREVGNPLRTE